MEIDFQKGNGLVPAIVQDKDTRQVLMLGYMNHEAYEKTLAGGKVTFFSRSKGRLWTKGETSGNFLYLESIVADCDNDTLLVLVRAEGAACHTGAVSCFGEESSRGFLHTLESIISRRIDEGAEDSYSVKLFRKGINKIAQKVGEEAVELVIEAKDDNEELFRNEAADLLYHFLVLLKAKKTKLEDVEKVLEARKR